jgi:hypothetical protein
VNGRRARHAGLPPRPIRPSLALRADLFRPPAGRVRALGGPGHGDLRRRHEHPPGRRPSWLPGVRRDLGALE